MRVVYVVETYTEGLGYIDNILPKELAAAGDEVHLITCRLPAYYQNAAAFFGDLTKKKDFLEIEHSRGVSLHTCSYTKLGGRVLINGLFGKLKTIDPDVVVVRGISSPVLAQVVLAKIFMGFKIFTSTGQAYSALPLALREGAFFSRARMFNFFSRVIPGRVFSLFVTKSIGSTQDCVDVIVDFYGVPRAKTKVISLGVDTDIFFPASDSTSLEERSVVRRELGISDEDIVCIWTGRMTKGKSVHVLARAVEELSSEGYRYVAIFVGAGPESETLKNYKKSIVKPFVPWTELSSFYRAADIAVWPRSITTSTLDASACGLPVILSDQEKAQERWEGIGSTYNEGCVASLKEKILEFHDGALRSSVGRAASSRMHSLYSWKVIAKAFRNEFQNREV